MRLAALAALAVVAAGLAGLAACASPDGAAPDGAPLAERRDGGPDAAANARPGPAGPPAAYVAPGACPFECCTYGDWRTTGPVPVYARERSRDVAFTLAAGAAIRADTGNVYVEVPGRVVADHAFPLGYEGEPGVEVAAGDTLYLLDNLGEGYLRVWYRGAAYETDGRYWNWQNMIEPQDPEQRYGRLLAEPRTSWWARVTDGEGRRGWVAMDEVDFLEGVDGCG